MSSNIARLGVALAINTVDFIKGLAVADEKSKQFKKSLREANQTAESLKTGVAIAGAALVAFGANALSVADEISDLADANDTTVGSIIELQHALEMSGGKADSAGKLLSSFTNSIDGAAQGSDKLRDSFKSVGVSISDLANLSADELKTKTLAGLAGIDDAVRRNAVAMDLFGKAAKGVDFSTLGSSAEALKGKYDAQAEAVKDAAAAFQKIKVFIIDMQLAAMQAMQPVSKLIDSLPTENRVDAMSKAFTVLGEAIFTAFAVRAVLGVKALSTQLIALAATNPYLFAFLTSAAAYKAYSSTNESQATHPNMAGEEGGALIFKLGGAFAGRPTAEQAAKAESGYNFGGQGFPQTDLSSDTTGGIRRILGLTEAQKKVIADAKKAAEDAKKLEQDFVEELEKAIDRQRKYNNEIDNLKSLQLDKNKQIVDEYYDQNALLDLEGRRYKLSDNQYQQEKLTLTQKIELRKINAQAIQDESAAMVELSRASSEDYERAKGIFDQKVLNIQKTAEMQKIVAVELGVVETQQLNESIARQHSWAEGWEDAMRRYEEASKKASDRGGAAFEMVVSSMDSALSKFVETGKLNFKDLIGTMIKQMLLMEMKAKASSIFSMLANTFLSAVTGFSSSAAAGVNASAGAGFGANMAASGGYIDSPTIVGENGAELFVPRTAGTVIPNGAWQSQVSGGGSGMTINGNYIANMSAIDTQSGMQFLAKNRDTIWAAYQSANRSVPISR